MKEVKTRVPDEIHERLKTLVANKNTSISDVVREILVRYLSGEQLDEMPVKVQAIKFRVKKRDAVCTFCGGTIRVGEWACFVIKELEDGRKIKEIWHIDCWEHASDATLAKKYVEMRKLERIRRYLKREVDKLADEYNEYQARKKVLDVAREVVKAMDTIEKKVFESLDLLREYMFNVEKSVELKQVIVNLHKSKEEILDKLDELKRKLDEVASQMIKEPIRKKKKEKEEWVWR